MKYCVLVLSLLWAFSGALPVRKDEAGEKKADEPSARPVIDTEEYRRYLDELVKNNPDMLERLSKIKDFDLDKLKDMMAKNPHLQERLNGAAVRSQMEEARRMDVEQMRELQKLQKLRENNLLKDNDWVAREAAARENLPPHFTKEQIQAKMAEKQHHLEELDSKRKEDFKHEEMWIEHRRRQKLAEMNEQQRLKSEEEFKKKMEERRKHDRLPQPGSKEQLEDVWEHDDGMTKQKFDPRTFFHMHDTNGDKVLDALEIEALFYGELQKVYKDDMGGIEAQEDMARMREHALTEMDQDKNGMISLQEFEQYTHKKAYENKEDWQPVVDEDPFSEKEFDKFEEDYDDDYDYQYDEHGNVVGIKPRKGHQDQIPEANEQGHPPDPQGGQPPHGNEQGQRNEGAHEVRGDEGAQARGAGEENRNHQQQVLQEQMPGQQQQQHGGEQQEQQQQQQQQQQHGGEQQQHGGEQQQQQQQQHGGQQQQQQQHGGQQQPDQQQHGEQPKQPSQQHQELLQQHQEQQQQLKARHEELLLNKQPDEQPHEQQQQAQAGGQNLL